MHEQITHEPLGVVANISAWNYPWFVGCNVFVPALLTGNAVLYKPSRVRHADGPAHRRLLHEAGVPADVMQCLVRRRRGRRGAAGAADRRRVLHRLPRHRRAHRAGGGAASW